MRQSEVEKTYRISKTTLHRWVKNGNLTDYRTVGGHRRYDSEEIEALLFTPENRCKQKGNNNVGN